MSPFWQRAVRISKEDFYNELDKLAKKIRDDLYICGARVYAENNGFITIVGIWCQIGSEGSQWTRRFYVVGCPHCTILDWDALRYPEKESGRARYLYQVLSGGRRPSVQIAISPAAEAAELAEAEGLDDQFNKPLVLGSPEGLCGRVRGSCLRHVPTEC